MHVGFFCKARFGTLLHLLQRMWWLVGTMEILLIFDETNSVEASPKSLQNHKNYISQKEHPTILYSIYFYCTVIVCSICVLQTAGMNCEVKICKKWLKEDVPVQIMIYLHQFCHLTSNAANVQCRKGIRT